MPIVDSYEKVDAFTGATYLYELIHVEDRWSVDCWVLHKDAENPCKEMEHHWTKTGVTTGYADNNPNRLIQEPFTEETARREFERWRN